VIGQPLLPVFGQQPGVFGNGVDVAGQPQGDDIGFEAVNYLV